MTNDAIDGDATRERDAVALLASSRAADDVARSIDAMTDEITRLRRGDAGAGAVRARVRAGMVMISMSSGDLACAWR